MTDLLERLKQQMFDDGCDGNLIEAAIDEIELLQRQVAKRNKVINYCINQIHDSSKLKYIGTMTRDMDT